MYIKDYNIYAFKDTFVIISMRVHYILKKRLLILAIHLFISILSRSGGAEKKV